jgi:hypothetical protein
MTTVLKIKLQDYSGNRTLYKNECSISNKQELVMIFSNLLSYGLDIRKIGEAMSKYEAEDSVKEVKERLEDEEEGPWFK